mmetsp:Transcript_17710/g.31579  ORF Transcript_17710/g.31579 Transcript_17710/m.31579 type:complete len:608 (-) Transcript_17710:154-1977(-)
MGAQCSPCSPGETSEILVEPGSGDSRSIDSARPKLAEADHFDKEYQLDVNDDTGILGHSSIGTVVKTRHRNSKRVHAVKTISKKSLEGTEWKGDIETIKKLAHPNICKINESWEDAMSIYLVMEFCGGGHLTGLGGAPEDKVNESTIACLIRQMVSAVGHLHEHNVVHSDIRPENWLFGEPVQESTTPLDMHLKMIDFGLASKHGRARPETRRFVKSHGQGMGAPHQQLDRRRTSSSKFSSARPTEEHDRILFCKAPEQVTNATSSSSNSDDKADVWALGIISFFLLSGQSPFQGPPEKDALFRNANFVFMPAELWRPVSAEAKNFIAMCLQRDPALRPTAPKMMSLPWMRLAESTLAEGNQLRQAGRWPPTSPQMRAMRSKLSMFGPPLPAAEKIKNSFDRMKRFNVLERVAVIAAAHRLPNERIPDLSEAFEKLDREKEGVLSAAEFLEGLESVGIPCGEMQKYVAGLDINSNRLIDYPAFVRAIEDFQRNMQENVVWAVFRNFDAKGAGSVAKKTIVEELKATSHKQAVTVNFPEVPLQDILDELEDDGDAQIDVEEFKRILRTSGRSGGSGASGASSSSKSSEKKNSTSGLKGIFPWSNSSKN